MSEKMTYAAQLRHPNWQRKRLQILERDGFTCQLCYDTETQLHVHHKRYIKGRLAWEYENEYLLTVCENCHHDAHELADELAQAVALLPIQSQGLPMLVVGMIAGLSQEEGGKHLHLQKSLMSAMQQEAGPDDFPDQENLLIGWHYGRLFNAFSSSCGLDSGTAKLVADEFQSLSFADREGALTAFHNEIQRRQASPTPDDFELKNLNWGDL